MTTVLVADDQAIVREGLCTLLELTDGIEVVGQAENGEQAVEAALRLRPDVVLMDLRMPVLDGAGATQHLRQELPATAVLVLTTYADDASIASALAAGARGYLTKDAGREELAVAVRSAAGGQVTFARDVGERIARSFAPAPSTAERFPSLTAREREVLDLVVEGRSNPEIAATLFLSVGTVKSHINSIFAKLGARDRAHAVALATGRA